MKKVLATLVISMACLVCMNSNAFAVMFTNTVLPGAILLHGQGSASWTHATPSDFEVPYDTVNSASLTVSALTVDGNNDQVLVEGVSQGTLTNGFWTWSSFDIADVFVQWTNGGTLDVTLNFNEQGWCNTLSVVSSTFVLDYDNGVAPGTSSSAVPEPATMALLGMGVLGLVGSKRKS